MGGRRNHHTSETCSIPIGKLLVLEGTGIIAPPNLWYSYRNIDGSGDGKAWLKLAGDHLLLIWQAELSRAELSRAELSRAETDRITTVRLGGLEVSEIIAHRRRI